MAKILAILVLALAAGSYVEAARNRGIMQNILGKFNGRHHAGRFHHGGQASSASASASAAASQPEPEYLAPPPSYYPPEPYYQPNGYHKQHYGYQPPVFSPPRYEPARDRSSGSSSSAAAAAAAGAGGASASGAAAANGAGRFGGSSGSASASAAAAAAAKPQHQFHVPPTPYVNHNAYPKFSRPTAYQAPPLDIASEIAAASSSAAASSTSGQVGPQHHGGHHLQGAHIPAAYGAQEIYRDEAPIHYVSAPHENVQAHSSGVYDGDNNGLNESSYYKKSSETEKNHEDGSEDSDHFLQSHSHGKSGEESYRVRQGRDDFTHEIGPYSVKIKKKNNFNFVDYNKSHSETGASVLQKDHHRSAYNRDTIKSKENIDAASTKYSNGRYETSGLKTNTFQDDEDSEYYDSAGVHGGQGYPSGAGSASASAAAGNSASSSSAAAAAGGH